MWHLSRLHVLVDTLQAVEDLQAGEGSQVCTGACQASHRAHNRHADKVSSGDWSYWVCVWVVGQVAGKWQVACIISAVSGLAAVICDIDLTARAST
jgi:hypothetical protein